MIGFYRAVNRLLFPHGCSYALPDQGVARQTVPDFPGFEVQVMPKSQNPQHRPHRVLVHCKCGRTISIGRINHHREVCKL